MTGKLTTMIAGTGVGSSRRGGVSIGPQRWLMTGARTGERRSRIESPTGP
jgi:hypothetical protein